MPTRLKSYFWFCSLPFVNICQEDGLQLRKLDLLIFLYNSYDIQISFSTEIKMYTCNFFYIYFQSDECASVKLTRSLDVSKQQAAGAHPEFTSAAPLGRLLLSPGRSDAQAHTRTLFSPRLASPRLQLMTSVCTLNVKGSETIIHDESELCSINVFTSNHLLSQQ